MKFQAIKEGCQQLVESIQSAISSQMIPSVITTGAATSAANPAYTAMEAKQKKNNFKTMLKNLALMFAELLQAAIMIAFTVPAMVLALLETLTTTKQLIETIPG